jgi:hypothetical protein
MGDAGPLLEALREAPEPSLIRGLGRFGHSDALGPLVDHLSHSDPEIVAAAAESLERITGAGLRETVEEPWDIDLPPEAKDVGALAIPTRNVDKIIVNPDIWLNWLKTHAGAFKAGVKLRGGAPFTPAHIVDELESRLTPPGRREEAWLELSLVTGIRSLFSPSDWVARQREHLAELRALVDARVETRLDARVEAPTDAAFTAPEPIRPAEISRPVAIDIAIAHDDRQAPDLPAEVVAAIEAIPVTLPGDTTLPIPPHEQARAGARSALPFRSGAPPPQPATPPGASPNPLVDPLATTLPPLERLGAEAKSVLPFQPPAGASPGASAPRLDQTADWTEAANQLGDLTKGGLPFTTEAAARLSQASVDQPSPSPEAALATTGEIPSAAQRQIREMAEHPLPFNPAPGAPAAPSTTLVLDPDDAPTLRRPTSPPQAPGAPQAPQPSILTLEQYAEIWLELERDPAKAAALRARYGLTDEVTWALVHWRWQERIGSDPALQQQFLAITGKGA